MLAKPPPGQYHKNTISLSVRLDEYLAKNTPAKEAYRRFKEHHDKEETTLLNAHLSLGVADIRRKEKVNSACLFVCLSTDKQTTTTVVMPRATLVYCVAEVAIPTVDAGIGQTSLQRTSAFAVEARLIERQITIL